MKPARSCSYWHSCLAGDAEPLTRKRALGLVRETDKILSNDLAGAKELVRLAGQYGAPLISHSALRYVPEVREFKKREKEPGRIHLAVWIGPGDLMNYGMHTVEPALAMFGSGGE